MRRAASTVPRMVRADSCFGTGRPAEPSSFVVRSLSLAMSTARAPVLDVIVARMRWAWTPWPSWTSEAELRRMKGMSRDAASSRMAAVDGPKATRSAWRRKALNSVSKSKPSSGSTRWLSSRTDSLPAATPTVSSV